MTTPPDDSQTPMTDQMATAVWARYKQAEDMLDEDNAKVAIEEVADFARSIETSLAAERERAATDKTYWDKTNQHLIDELAAERRRVKELEQEVARWKDSFSNAIEQAHESERCERQEAGENERLRSELAEYKCQEAGHLTEAHEHTVAFWRGEAACKWWNELTEEQRSAVSAMSSSQVFQLGYQAGRAKSQLDPTAAAGLRDAVQKKRDEYCATIKERDQLRSDLASLREEQMQALGLTDDDHTVIADEIRRIRDEGRAHFHDVTKLTADLASLREDGRRREAWRKGKPFPPELKALSDEAVKYANATPVVLSLLYDLDLMPEQLEEGSKYWGDMIGVIDHFKSAIDNAARQSGAGEGKS